MQLPHTLKRIEQNAFDNCWYLWNIKLPDSLEYIGKWCFSKSELTKVQIPRNGVKTDYGAFNDCPAQSSLVFRDGRVFPKGQ